MKNFNKIVAAGAVLATLALQSGVAFASSSAATVQSDTLSRAKVGEVATHDIKLTLAGTATFTVTLPTDFTAVTGTPAVTTGSAVLAGNVITVTGGTVGVEEITGISATNPSLPGSYYVALGGTDVTGGYALAIVTDDQVGVTASVEPSITFNVGAQAKGTDCAAGFNGNGGTVALGVLTTSDITSSDVNSVAHICTRVSTNATGGAIVTVKSANQALESISVNADVIPSATASMTAGVANYGLCADATQHGMDTTNPASYDPTAVAPFIASCVHNTAAGAVGALTTAAQTVWHVDHPTSNSFQNLVVKAAISGTTKAHSDYADTLTFVATGTF